MHEEDPPAPPRVERLGRLNNQDNPVAAVLRFNAEVATWLAIQYVWGWGAVIVAILTLAVLNARGDKQVGGILVPGAFRIMLELGVMAVGVAAAAMAVGPWAGIALGLIVVLQAIAGRRRYRWLLRQ